MTLGWLDERLLDIPGGGRMELREGAERMWPAHKTVRVQVQYCLLYTSDAADE